MPKSIHHVAIVVHDLDQALAFYRDALGLEVADRRQVPEEGVEIAFLPTGEAEIELIQPLTEEGGVARFLEKRGEGLHHICLAVEDGPGGLEAAKERLEAAGARVLGEEPQVGADGNRYVFVHPESAHGVLIELYEAPE
ncbi:MAG: methylmalonyl-CoA epimerase [Anaerolineae bacterium]|jgi:methylmalonyl-CoA epimerase